MFFPYRTDAPVYHFPYATIGLIVVNVIAFVAILGSSSPEQYILQYGVGLKPLQWVTSNFVHAGPLHLLGNMLFLWTFGLLVEGKVGAAVFVPLYLGIGFVQCGLEQAAMMALHIDEGGSLGASAIILGLMAIAMVWSPKNDVSVLGLGFSEFDVPILLFAGLMFAWELVTMSFFKFTVGTAVLHMSGAVVGFVVGVAFLKLGWVDCEGWDLFTVLTGEPGELAAKKKRKKKKKPRPSLPE